jgi:dsRNA-specific ribonuclease
MTYFNPTIMMNTEYTPSTIYYGSRGNDFKQLILSLLKKGKLKDHYIKLLMDDEGLKIYNDVFTSNSANAENNYEVYEQLGDVLAGSFIIWYMYRRFPQLQCPEAVKIVARLKINYGARASFFLIGESLGFWPFITATEEERTRERKDLLEDTLEAFIGATAFILDNKIRQGVGYAIVYDILSSIFDSMTISLKYEDLYDSITRLKEIFDYFKDRIGTQKKDFVKEEKLTTFKIYRIHGGSTQLLGTGIAAKKTDAEQKAAAEAIQNLNRIGFSKPIPEIYLKYCK